MADDESLAPKKDNLDDIFGEKNDDVDLFGGSKSDASIDSKKDLFGDSTADDDLFGESKLVTKEESEEFVTPPPGDSSPTQVEEPTKTEEPVTDDPLKTEEPVAEPVAEAPKVEEPSPVEEPPKVEEPVKPTSEEVDIFGETSKDDLFSDPAPQNGVGNGHEEPDDDKLFDEEISLEDDGKPKPRLTLEKSKEELSEEEGGDTFDIVIKVSDPMKVGDGMNAYMAYSVTTQTSLASFKRSDFSVKRRFSDFLGLHERLSEKHMPYGRIVPPPPDKSVVGMVKVKGSKDDQASTDFVSKRQHALEKFLNRISKHKLLLDDHDFKEFLEAEELPRAKNTSALSKGGLSRLAKGVGEAFSKMTSKMTETDSWFEEKQSRIDDLDQQVKKLHAASEMLVSLRREVSVNTSAFAKSVSLLSSTEEHSRLSRALAQLAELEEKVELVHAEQASTDFYLLSETLREYIGLIASVKAAFSQRVKVWGNWQNAQSTLSKKREALVKFELAQKADKVEAAKDEVVEWERRVEKGEEEFDTISKSIKVEMAAFEMMRIRDFKALIISYLESLLGIEQQLVKLWESYSPIAKSIC